MNNNNKNKLVKIDSEYFVKKLLLFVVEIVEIVEIEF